MASIGKNLAGIQADSDKLPIWTGSTVKTKEAKGRLDVIGMPGGGSMLPLGQITEEQYNDTFDRNVKGVLSWCEKALPVLVDGDR